VEIHLHSHNTSSWSGALVYTISSISVKMYRVNFDMYSM
jgi:hypothetical protein